MFLDRIDTAIVFYGFLKPPGVGCNRSGKNTSRKDRLSLTLREGLLPVPSVCFET